MLTVIFDADCGICQALREQAARRDKHGRLTFVPYQRADLEAISPGLTADMTSRSLYVVFPDGRRWRGARAVAAVMRELPGFWKVLGMVGAWKPVSLLLDPFYRLVANNRSRISRRLGLMACRLGLSHPKADM